MRQSFEKIRHTTKTSLALNTVNDIVICFVDHKKMNQKIYIKPK